MSDGELDTLLDCTVALFRFLADKDLFERYYKQHLAKRLLFNRTTSDDAERGVIQRLKKECGFAFTSKLAGMFTDMEICQKTMADWKNHCAKKKVGNLAGLL